MPFFCLFPPQHGEADQQIAAAVIIEGRHVFPPGAREIRIPADGWKENSMAYAVTIFSASWSFSSSTASSRILYFRIFPAAFMGKESTKRK